MCNIPTICISCKKIEITPPVVIEPPDFGPTGLIWTTCEQITIDDNFKYYNSELTGNPKVDLQLIYGSKDVHDSVGILTRPTEDNIAKIKIEKIYKTEERVEKKNVRWSEAK